MSSAKVAWLTQELSRIDLQAGPIEETDATTFTLVLTPSKLLTVSPRLLQLCVNVFGKRKPLKRDYTWELGWFLTPLDDGTVKLELFNTVHAWWTDEQLKTLVWLLRIGTNMSSEIVGQESLFSPNLLLHVYQTSDELEQMYKSWLATC